MICTSGTGKIDRNVLPVSEFRDLLEAAAKLFSTKREFAGKLGITPGRLSRVLGGEHSLDPMNCLRLAQMTGATPSRVLRIAGKGELAEMIESLYGPGRPTVSASQRELLDQFDRISQRARDGVKAVLGELPQNDGVALREFERQGDAILETAVKNRRKRAKSSRR
jgi:plasmid maintenance system antidote protein VapI